ncbi:MAG: cupredoxin domain-containing protein [Myxococcales bacterium]|nr:cupredoxin domain-containing protein [Myxococcales bacterium]
MVTRSLFALILFLAPAAMAESPAEPTPTSETSEAVPEPVVVEVRVQDGYHPDRVSVPAGRPVVLRFLRTEYAGCTREVVFPTRDLRVELPTDQPVDVELGMLEPGELPFHCGMHMNHGTVIAAAE